LKKQKKLSLSHLLLQRIQVHVLPGLEQHRELMHDIRDRGVLGLFCFFF